MVVVSQRVVLALLFKVVSPLVGTPHVALIRRTPNTVPPIGLCQYCKAIQKHHCLAEISNVSFLVVIV